MHPIATTQPRQTQQLSTPRHSRGEPCKTKISSLESGEKFTIQNMLEVTTQISNQGRTVKVTVTKSSNHDIDRADASAAATVT